MPNPLDHPTVRNLLKLFDHLPEVYFFVKDEESRFLHANDSLIERLGLPDRDSIVGTTDYDRYPEEIADQLVDGDRHVMKSGEPLVDHLDVLFNEVGTLEWFSTTKYPVYSEDNSPMGVVGFTRSFSTRHYRPFEKSAATRMIDHVSKHPDDLLSVEDFAKRFSISPRQLHRQFRSLLGISAQEFLLRTRIHASAVALRNTDETVASIATQFGFCDQSAFTKRFQKVLGTTPAKYRRGVSRQRSSAPH